MSLVSLGSIIVRHQTSHQTTTHPRQIDSVLGDARLVHYRLGDTE